MKSPLEARNLVINQPDFDGMIRDCSASSQDDKEVILKKIVDVDALLDLTNKTTFFQEIPGTQ